MFKKILPIILLSLTYLIGQLYCFFETSYYDSMGNVNWILDNQHAMPVSWNVKYLSEEVNRIIEAIFILMVVNKKEKLWQLCCIIYLTYRLLDLVVYFLNFKTGNYWIVLLITSFIEAYMWFNKDFKKWLNQ